MTFEIRQGGFVKLWRNIADLGLPAPALGVYLYLLSKATHKAKVLYNMTLKEGQYVTTMPALKDALKMEIQPLRTALKQLEKISLINRQTTNKFTLITVNNYNDLCLDDGNEKTSTQQTTNRQLTDNQQATNRQSTRLKQEREERKDFKERKENPPYYPSQGSEESGGDLPLKKGKGAKAEAEAKAKILMATSQIPEEILSYVREGLKAKGTPVADADIQAEFEGYKEWCASSGSLPLNPKSGMMNRLKKALEWGRVKVYHHNPNAPAPFVNSNPHDGLNVELKKKFHYFRQVGMTEEKAIEEQWMKRGETFAYYRAKGYDI